MTLHTVSSCGRCGGSGVVSIADAFALKISDAYIAAFRCGQYVLCNLCQGSGLRARRAS